MLVLALQMRYNINMILKKYTGGYMQIIKMDTEEQLKNLKKNDRLLVHWKEGSDAYRKGEHITMTRIWGINSINEVIVREKDNLYFSIENYINNKSIAKEAYLVTE
jgi:hypothetical protein